MNYSIKKSKKKKFTDKSDFLKKPTEKKIKNILLSKIHSMNDNEKKSLKAFKCGNYLKFSVDCNNKRKLISSNFCRARLCPMCSWKLSKKRFVILSNIIKELYQKGNYQLLFLTLTIKNCFGDVLRENIKKILDSWKYLATKNSIFKKSIHGWFRALEVTYNQELNTYHPHLHIVLVVKPYYFDGKYYITQDKWVQMWQSALNVDYLPVVHICKEYKNKNCNKNISTLVSEASKYATKDTDYIISNNLKLSADIVKLLDSALVRLRLVAYGGILKIIYKNIKADELENNDNNNDKLNEDLENIIEIYRWSIGVKKYIKDNE